MNIRNPNWYDLNEQRSWPLDELATHSSVSGERIAYDLIVDMNMQFPKIMGTYAYLGSITVGPKLATVTIISDLGVPLATANISGAEKWRHYPLESDYPGVGGWIVFGSAIDNGTLGSFSFAGISSGKLMPKVARSYGERPVTGMGKKGVEQLLTDIVQMEGGNDIEIVKESREIEGKMVDAIVIRLKNKRDVSEKRNIFSDYIGTCEARPESQNCDGNLPIEFINSVQPDCFGDIKIEFRGCAEITIDEGGCGIVVDCGLALSDACVTPDHLPDETGRLPNEYDDLCVDVSISIITEEDTILEGESVIDYAPEDCTAHQMSSLPYTADFASSTIPSEFTMVQGISEIQFDNQAASFGGMSLVFNPGNNTNATFTTGKGQGSIGIFENGAIFTDTAWRSICRSIDVWLVIKEGEGVGVHRNAGVVFNYRDSPTIIGGKDYWVAYLDWDEKLFEVKHFNGASYTTLSSVDFSNIRMNQQYQVTLEVFEAPNQKAWITATVTNSLLVTDPDYVNLTIGPFLADNVKPYTGHVGFLAYKSEADFNKIIVDNTTP